MDAKERKELAETRLIRVIGTHGIANARTLEQKISDAGPFNQRIDPHILTDVRNDLVKRGEILRVTHSNAPWFHLPDTRDNTIKSRLADQLPVYDALNHGALSKRVGQCLEIAIYRSLLEQKALHFLGGFSDLDEHDDSTLFAKDEPPLSLNGKRLAGQQRLDFLVCHPQFGWAGIEAKNVRPWLYPHDEDIVEAIAKCVTLDCVPVLIARRIPFVTFKLFSACGVIVHQTYNQLVPEAESELATKARDKTILGYHDLRTGNHPDKRLTKFIHVNLPKVLGDAREKFDEFKDLLRGYSIDGMSYEEFAARVRRRTEGSNETFDTN